HQIPIWFFIGALIGFYGLIIFGTGIYEAVNPPPVEEQVALYNLHADIWWGAMMTILGAFYCIRFRPT
ncbi:MAG TPA: hypothetical protein VIH42_02645, partial [Thermoguttaceae bacterium]